MLPQPSRESPAEALRPEPHGAAPGFADPSPESPPEEYAPRRARWLRRAAAICARLNNKLLGTSSGAWLHRRLESSLSIEPLEVVMLRLGEELDGLRIVYLSDLHAGLFMTEADLLRLAERAMELKPDLIGLGGDLINARQDELHLLAPALRLLEAPLGVFAVPGNHDREHVPAIGLWQRFLSAHGVEVLINRGLHVSWKGTELWVCGVDDMREGQADLHEALRGRREGEPSLLLSHHPDLFLQAAREGVDLQLSGHTHGGQVRLLGWAPITHSRHGFLHGLYRRGDSQLYVGQGAGVAALPIRVGTRPEVALLRLTRSPFSGSSSAATVCRVPSRSR